MSALQLYKVAFKAHSNKQYKVVISACLCFADVEYIATSTAPEAAEASATAPHRLPSDEDVAADQQQRWRKSQKLLDPSDFVHVCDRYL